MLSINDDISKLSLSPTIINKLKRNNFNIISDIWSITRKTLKKYNFSDQEIKSIIISLQLEGLDLNKKIYDK